MPRKHTHVQLIYLAADTRPGLRPSSSVMPTREEAERQAKHLAKVVKYAWNSGSLASKVIDPSRSTLKVFMAPEFYIRHPKGYRTGVNHFTRMDFIAVQAALRKALAGFLIDQQWLVVAGTAIWKLELPFEKNEFLQNTITAFDFTAKGMPSEHFCDKNYFSRIDDLSAELNAASPEITRPDEVGYGPQQSFEIDGLKIGMEVCLDHDAGVLRKHIEDRNKPFLDLHLIVACGMDLKADRCAAAESSGCFVLRCNGNGYNAYSAYFADPNKHDPTIRSDVYGYSPTRHGWSRHPHDRTPENFQYLPHDLQRPWLVAAGTQGGPAVSDGIGFFPVFALRP